LFVYSFLIPLCGGWLLVVHANIATVSVLVELWNVRRVNANLSSLAANLSVGLIDILIVVHRSEGSP